MSVHFQKPQGKVQVMDSTAIIIAAKVREIKGLAHTLFVEVRHAWDVYQEAKDTCHPLAVGPRPKYDEAVLALKLAVLGDEVAFRQAVKLLAPQNYALRQARWDRVQALREALKGSFQKPHIYIPARKVADNVARAGGLEYDRLLNLTRFAACDNSARVEALEILFPQAVKKLAIQPVQITAEEGLQDSVVARLKKAAGILV